MSFPRVTECLIRLSVSLGDYQLLLDVLTSKPLTWSWGSFGKKETKGTILDTDNGVFSRGLATP